MFRAGAAAAAAPSFSLGLELAFQTRPLERRGDAATDAGSGAGVGAPALLIDTSAAAAAAAPLSPPLSSPRRRSPRRAHLSRVGGANGSAAATAAAGSASLHAQAQVAAQARMALALMGSSPRAAAATAAAASAAAHALPLPAPVAAAAAATGAAYPPSDDTASDPLHPADVVRAPRSYSPLNLDASSSWSVVRAAAMAASSARYPNYLSAKPRGLWSQSAAATAAAALAQRERERQAEGTSVSGGARGRQRRRSMADSLQLLPPDHLAPDLAAHMHTRTRAHGRSRSMSPSAHERGARPGPHKAAELLDTDYYFSDSPVPDERARDIPAGSGSGSAAATSTSTSTSTGGPALSPSRLNQRRASMPEAGWGDDDDDGAEGGGGGDASSRALQAAMSAHSRPALASPRKASPSHSTAPDGETGSADAGTASGHTRRGSALSTSSSTSALLHGQGQGQGQGNGQEHRRRSSTFGQGSVSGGSGRRGSNASGSSNGGGGVGVGSVIPYASSVTTSFFSSGLSDAELGRSDAHYASLLLLAPSMQRQALVAARRHELEQQQQQDQEVRRMLREQIDKEVAAERARVAQMGSRRKMSMSVGPPPSLSPSSQQALGDNGTFLTEADVGSLQAQRSPSAATDALSGTHSVGAPSTQASLLFPFEQRPLASGLPYHMQGDLAWHRGSALARRSRLERAPAVRAVIQKFWSVFVCTTPLDDLALPPPTSSAATSVASSPRGARARAAMASEEKQNHSQTSSTASLRSASKASSVTGASGGGGGGGSFTLTRTQYLTLHMCMSKALHEVWSWKAALALAEAEWRRDVRGAENAGGDGATVALPATKPAQPKSAFFHPQLSPSPTPAGSPRSLLSKASPASKTGTAAGAAVDNYPSATMSQRLFSRALFEVADLWTEEVSEGVYADFLSVLLGRLTKPNPAFVASGGSKTRRTGAGRKKNAPPPPPGSNPLLSTSPLVWRELSEVARYRRPITLPPGGYFKVLLIQRWWRRWWCVRQERMAVRIQRAWRKWAPYLRRRRFVRDRAARILQSFMRRRWARQRLLARPPSPLKPKRRSEGRLREGEEEDDDTSSFSNSDGSGSEAGEDEEEYEDTSNSGDNDSENDSGEEDEDEEDAEAAAAAAAAAEEEARAEEERNGKLSLRALREKLHHQQRLDEQTRDLVLLLWAARRLQRFWRTVVARKDADHAAHERRRAAILAGRGRTIARQASKAQRARDRPFSANLALLALLDQAGLGDRRDSATTAATPTGGLPSPAASIAASRAGSIETRAAVAGSAATATQPVQSALSGGGGGKSKSKTKSVAFASASSASTSEPRALRNGVDGGVDDADDGGGADQAEEPPSDTAAVPLTVDGPPAPTPAPVPAPTRLHARLHSYRAFPHLLPAHVVGELRAFLERRRTQHSAVAYTAPVACARFLHALLGRTSARQRRALHDLESRLAALRRRQRKLEREEASSGLAKLMRGFELEQQQQQQQDQQQPDKHDQTPTGPTSLSVPAAGTSSSLVPPLPLSPSLGSTSPSGGAVTHTHTHAHMMRRSTMFVSLEEMGGPGLAAGSPHMQGQFAAVPYSPRMLATASAASVAPSAGSSPWLGAASPAMLPASPSFLSTPVPPPPPPPLPPTLAGILAAIAELESHPLLLAQRAAAVATAPATVTTDPSGSPSPSSSAALESSLFARLLRAYPTCGPRFVLLVTESYPFDDNDGPTGNGALAPVRDGEGEGEGRNGRAGEHEENASGSGSDSEAEIHAEDMFRPVERRAASGRRARSSSRRPAGGEGGRKTGPSKKGAAAAASKKSTSATASPRHRAEARGGRRSVHRSRAGSRHGTDRSEGGGDSDAHTDGGGAAAGGTSAFSSPRHAHKSKLQTTALRASSRAAAAEKAAPPSPSLLAPAADAATASGAASPATSARKAKQLARAEKLKARKAKQRAKDIKREERRKRRVLLEMQRQAAADAAGGAGAPPLAPLSDSDSSSSSSLSSSSSATSRASASERSTNWGGGRGAGGDDDEEEDELSSDSELDKLLDHTLLHSDDEQETEQEQEQNQRGDGDGDGSASGADPGAFQVAVVEEEASEGTAGAVRNDRGAWVVQRRVRVPTRLRRGRDSITASAAGMGAGTTAGTGPNARGSIVVSAQSKAEVAAYIAMLRTKQTREDEANQAALGQLVANSAGRGSLDVHDEGEQPDADEDEDADAAAAAAAGSGARRVRQSNRRTGTRATLDRDRAAAASAAAASALRRGRGKRASAALPAHVRGGPAGGRGAEGGPRRRTTGPFTTAAAQPSLSPGALDSAGSAASAEPDPHLLLSSDIDAWGSEGGLLLGGLSSPAMRVMRLADVTDKLFRNQVAGNIDIARVARAEAAARTGGADEEAQQHADDGDEGTYHDPSSSSPAIVSPSNHALDGSDDAAGPHAPAAAAAATAAEAKLLADVRAGMGPREYVPTTETGAGRAALRGRPKPKSGAGGGLQKDASPNRRGGARPLARSSSSTTTAALDAPSAADVAEGAKGQRAMRNSASASALEALSPWRSGVAHEPLHHSPHREGQTGAPTAQPARLNPAEVRSRHLERQERAAERRAERLRLLVAPTAELLASRERSFRKGYDTSSGRRMDLVLQQRAAAAAAAASAATPASTAEAKTLDADQSTEDALSAQSEEGEEDPPRDADVLSSRDASPDRRGTCSATEPEDAAVEGAVDPHGSDPAGVDGGARGPLRRRAARRQSGTGDMFPTTGPGDTSAVANVGADNGNEIKGDGLVIGAEDGGGGGGAASSISPRESTLASLRRRSSGVMSVLATGHIKLEEEAAPASQQPLMLINRAAAHGMDEALSAAVAHSASQVSPTAARRLSDPSLTARSRRRSSLPSAVAAAIDDGIAVQAPSERVAPANDGSALLSASPPPSETGTEAEAEIAPNPEPSVRGAMETVGSKRIDAPLAHAAPAPAPAPRRPRDASPARSGPNANAPTLASSDPGQGGATEQRRPPPQYSSNNNSHHPGSALLLPLESFLRVQSVGVAAANPAGAHAASHRVVATATLAVVSSASTGSALAPPHATSSAIVALTPIQPDLPSPTSSNAQWRRMRTLHASHSPRPAVASTAASVAPTAITPEFAPSSVHGGAHSSPLRSAAHAPDSEVHSAGAVSHLPPLLLTSLSSPRGQSNHAASLAPSPRPQQGHAPLQLQQQQQQQHHRAQMMRIQKAGELAEMHAHSARVARQEEKERAYRQAHTAPHAPYLSALRPAQELQLQGRSAASASASAAATAAAAAAVVGPSPMFLRDPSGRLYRLFDAADSEAGLSGSGGGSQSARAVASSRSEGHLPLLPAPLTHRASPRGAPKHWTRGSPRPRRAAAHTRPAPSLSAWGSPRARGASGDDDDDDDYDYDARHLGIDLSPSMHRRPRPRYDDGGEHEDQYRFTSSDGEGGATASDDECATSATTGGAAAAAGSHAPRMLSMPVSSSASLPSLHLHSGFGAAAALSALRAREESPTHASFTVAIDAAQVNRHRQMSVEQLLLPVVHMGKLHRGISIARRAGTDGSAQQRQQQHQQQVHHAITGLMHRETGGSMGGAPTARRWAGSMDADQRREAERRMRLARAALLHHDHTADEVTDREPVSGLAVTPARG